MAEKRILWVGGNGLVHVLMPANNAPEEAWRKDIPAGVDIVETTTDGLPPDFMFHDAWEIRDGRCVEVLEKAKEVAHRLRRARRDQEFEPHDAVIAKRIPGEAEAEAEAARAAIRAKYATVQAQIDACTSTQELRSILR